MANRIAKNVVFEGTFESSVKYKDPFNEIELDVIFIDMMLSLLSLSPSFS